VETVKVRNDDLIPVARPRMLKSSTTKVALGCDYKMYVTVSADDNGDPFEVFAHVGKSGSCIKAQVDGLCRCISAALRSGMPVGIFVHSLKNMSCNHPIIGGAKSCDDAIASVLENYIKKEAG